MEQTLTTEQIESLQTVYSGHYARTLSVEVRLKQYLEFSSVTHPELSQDTRQQVFFIFERIRNTALSH